MNQRKPDRAWVGSVSNKRNPSRSRVFKHVLALELPWVSKESLTGQGIITVIMSHSQFRSTELILRHAWLNL
jgi:hypothetical protein